MKKTYKMVLLVCWIMVLLCTSGCLKYTDPLEQIGCKVPDEGIWSCSELEITLSFDDQPSTIRVDGRTINCRTENERNTPMIALYCTEKNDPVFYNYKCMFLGTVIQVEESMMIIQEYETDIAYTFYKMS